MGGRFADPFGRLHRRKVSEVKRRKKMEPTPFEQHLLLWDSAPPECKQGVVNTYDSLFTAKNIAANLFDSDDPLLVLRVARDLRNEIAREKREARQI